ncbi:MAG TPA: hypothetical protein VJH03_13165 [Blastocatellia bacterium]|nr:hypothetical protein [Blastocatellia bacterium]
MTRFRYKDSVLAELARHGVAPTEETTPDLVREYVNDLYVYEIRKLRDRLRNGLVRKEDYAVLVDELRRRYPILSLPIQFWTEPVTD